MFGQENSGACWGLTGGKHPPSSGAGSRGQRRNKSRSAKAGVERIMLCGEIRELALYRAEVLRYNGFTVVTPRDRAEAVAEVERGDLSVAILSYTLSNDTVQELAELLKQKCPECQLIAISQTGRVDRRIDPDAIVIAGEGPAALLEALSRVTRKPLQ